MFDIAIQTGAIVAVIIVYWGRIRETLAGLPREQKAQLFTLNVLIGFFPAVILGLLLATRVWNAKPQSKAAAPAPGASAVTVQVPPPKTGTNG